MSLPSLLSGFLVVALGLVAPTGARAAPESVPPSPTATAPSSPVVELPEAGFDPLADPETDLRQALSEARDTGRRVLVKVGGNWCVWCRIMEKTFMEDSQLADLLEENFVLQKLNVSKENKNKAFLARFPAVSGYPHLFVLENDGTLLHSQGTGSLEAGRGYDREKIRTFLQTWAPTQEAAPPQEAAPTQD